MTDIIQFQINFNADYNTYDEKIGKYTVDITRNGIQVDNFHLSEINKRISDIDVKIGNRLLRGKYYRITNWTSTPELVEPFKIRGVGGGIFFLWCNRTVKYNGQIIDIDYPEAVCHKMSDFQVLTNGYVDLNTPEKAVMIKDIDNNDINLKSFTFTLEATLAPKISNINNSILTTCIIL